MQKIIQIKQPHNGQAIERIVLPNPQMEYLNREQMVFQYYQQNKDKQLNTNSGSNSVAGMAFAAQNTKPYTGYLK